MASRACRCAITAPSRASGRLDWDDGPSAAICWAAALGLSAKPPMTASRTVSRRASWAWAGSPGTVYVAYAAAATPSRCCWPAGTLMTSPCLTCTSTSASMPPMRSTRAARPPTAQCPGAVDPDSQGVGNTVGAGAGRAGWPPSAATPRRSRRNRPRAGWARSTTAPAEPCWSPRRATPPAPSAPVIWSRTTLSGPVATGAAGLGAWPRCGDVPDRRDDQSERQERDEHLPQAVGALPGFMPGERARAERGDAGRQDGGVACRRERPARGRGGRWIKGEGRTGGDGGPRAGIGEGRSARVRAGQGACVRAGGTSRRCPGQRAEPEGSGRSRPRNPLRPAETPGRLRSGPLARHAPPSGAWR